MGHGLHLWLFAVKAGFPLFLIGAHILEEVN